MAARIEPYKVHISDEALSKLQEQLKTARMAKATYEQMTSARYFGMRNERLGQLREYWQSGFDWRKQEAKLNQVAHFMAHLPQKDGSVFRMHFIHERSDHPDAVPILLLHGWPGSFVEFIGLVKQLRGQRFSLIVPSLPGYGFSDPPYTDRPMTLPEVGRLCSQLMRELGYEAYVTQGGDIGSFISRYLGVTDDRIKSVHLNMSTAGPPPTPLHAYMPSLTRTVPGVNTIARTLNTIFKPLLRPSDQHGLTVGERQNVARSRKFAQHGRAYIQVHATRASTISLAVSSNPVALLAWVGDKLIEWTDGELSDDELLTLLTLWHVQDTFPSSIYPYWQLGQVDDMDPKWYIRKPTGFSNAKDLFPAPKAWVAQTCNLVFYRFHPRAKASHFLAWQDPETLAQDLRDFVDQVWQKGNVQAKL